MNVLDRLTTSESLNEVYSETPLRLFLTIIVGAIVGTVLAAIIDLNTGLPTYVWASAWYVVPTLTWMLFGLPARHGYGKAKNGSTQRAIRSYLGMTKVEKREFPKNTLKMLQTEDYAVVENFNLAAEDLISLRRNVGAEGIISAREQMEQVRSNIAITKKTYDELG